MANPSKLDIKSEISRTLAKRRQIRNIPIEEIGQTLKIRVPVLKALEEGKWDQLPGGVYLKGFLKKYADYLGLDGEKLVAPYFKTTSFAPKQQDEEEKGESTEQHDSHTKTLWISIGLGVILLMGLIKFLAQDFRESSSRHPMPTPSQLEEKEISPKEETPVGEEAINEHTMEVFSPFPLWLGVEAGDKTFEGFLPEGSTWSWKGVGKFSIRLGHTRDISLYFDGKVVEISENQKRVFLPDEN